MLTSWKNWCRLCANEKASLNLGSVNDINSLISSIVEASIIEIVDVSANICDECCSFINKVERFKERCEQTNRLFVYFMQCSEDGVQDYDIEDIRNKYLAKLDLDDMGERLREEIDIETQEILPLEPMNEVQNVEEIENVEEEGADVLYRVESMSISPHHQHLEMLELQLQDCSNEPDASDENEDGVFDTDPDYNHEVEIKTSKRIIRRQRNSAGGKQSAAFTRNNRPKGRPPSNKTNKDDGQTKRMFRCEYCFKSWSTQSALKKHEVIHLPDEEKLIYSCHICHKKFSKLINVKSHIRLIHEGEKPFICEECGKPFGSRGALKEHFIVHTEDRPFQCAYCPKQFKNAARLKTHEDIHNDTLYVCPHCGLKLNTKRTLNMHMVVHSDQKKYKCQECGNEYKRSKALKSHLILHTGLRPYQCPFCDKSFANGSNCRSHKKKFHPRELAALEASGRQKPAANIPKLEHLRQKPEHLDVQAGVPKKLSVRSLAKLSGREQRSDDTKENTHFQMPGCTKSDVMQVVKLEN